MKTKLLALAAFVLGASASAQVLAHHSFAAEFDGNSPIELHGVPTRTPTSTLKSKPNQVTWKNGPWKWAARTA